MIRSLQKSSTNINTNIKTTVTGNYRSLLSSVSMFVSQCCTDPDPECSILTFPMVHCFSACRLFPLPASLNITGSQTSQGLHMSHITSLHFITALSNTSSFFSLFFNFCVCPLPMTLKGQGHLIDGSRTCT